MNKAFFIFCKIISAINNAHHKLYSRFKLAYYFYVSRQRFVLKSSITIGKRFSIQTDLTDTSILINDHCHLKKNFNIALGDGGKLTIGKNCFFNNNCSISCRSKISIGDNNQFGEMVLLYDHNHVYVNREEFISAQGYTVGDITIGNNCWIGSHVVILKNVTIGDNVVIGAGCVIYKSIPSNAVVTTQQDLKISIQ
jgi:acetyltransferase-like isoleucine patch superfamily enzyme